MIERANRIDEADSRDLDVVEGSLKSFKSTDTRQYIDGKKLTLPLQRL